MTGVETQRSSYHSTASTKYYLFRSLKEGKTSTPLSGYSPGPFYNEDKSVLGPFIHSPLPILTFTAAQRTKTERSS